MFVSIGIYVYVVASLSQDNHVRTRLELHAFASHLARLARWYSLAILPRNCVLRAGLCGRRLGPSGSRCRRDSNASSRRCSFHFASLLLPCRSPSTAHRPLSSCLHDRLHAALHSCEFLVPRRYSAMLIIPDIARRRLVFCHPCNIPHGISPDLPQTARELWFR